ncbi:hypothetical protein BW686_01180 [Pseudomonas syringae]|uniref:Water stress and hypersensitive response domain-containing protein n=1 Tax=Pseudomonas syringae TaxID=317 RepID=A0A244EXR7_PSESX|nr:LEA type 2 family protein [Pseudomonas syringae]OUM09337.1 hypothetical protein BW686_01180 [Pseudomonas syringae]
MSFQAHIIRILSLALFMFGLSGCSLLSFDSFKDPEVHLVKVEVIKARLTHQDFRLSFEVDNPNDSRLLVRGLTYKIMLNEALLAEGKSSDWSFVEGNGRKTLLISVQTNLWQHARYIAKLLKKPDQPIHYQLEGKLKTGLVFRHTVRVLRSGDVIPGDLIKDRR